MLLAFATRAIAQPSTSPAVSAHPALQEALQHLLRRRWERLTVLVRALPPQSAFVLIDDLGDASELDGNIGGLERQPMGATISGGLLVNWGWRYRGTGLGSGVGASNFAAFQQRLQSARANLDSALTADAEDGVAASLLIRTQKGLQDLPATDAAFRAFETADRRPIAGYAGYADAISGKWYGSQERMLGFARQHRASLPPSSHALIPQAHIESMLALMRSSDPERAVLSQTYLTGDFVRGEIVAANDAFVAAPTDPDVFANRFAYGQFSYAFMLMGDLERARPHMQGMGRYPVGPWSQLPDPRRSIDEARRLLGINDL